MYRYKCDICGSAVYVDPNEPRICDGCLMRQKQAVIRAKKAKAMSAAVRISDGNQYEMVLEVG